MIAEKRKCLDTATLADLLAGRMPTDRFSNAIEHIESCERCMRAAEENSKNSKLPWLVEASDSSLEREFDIEPECAAVVGNLLVQPVPTAGDRSGSHVEVSPPREMLGPYRLISSLGSGGMGTVYLAEHQRLKRQVAIKLLPRDKLARSGWLDRFNREMTAIAALEHPHVVRALDAGDEDQWHYLVMEYLDGLDLNRVARRIPDIPVGAACEIIRQAALGLGAIHEAGMIHRDIKPSNVFLTQTGSVKLLDLGLVLDGESPLLADERLTTVGHLMGTLPFMAREQLDDARNVDWRADIYSLGATLYRLLCGRPPYGSADNLARTIQAISTTEAPTIASRRSDLPIELVAIVDRMLSSDAGARPQSAQEVAELLQPFCDESGPKGLIRSAMQCTVEDEVSVANVSPLVAPSFIAPPRSRWPRWIAVALVPFAFAAGIFVTIATDRGTLVIETDEPNAALKIVQGDKVVDQLEVTQSRPSTLQLRSGSYVIELTGVDSDRMEVKNNQVVLSRGERQVVKVIRKELSELTESHSQTADSLKPTTVALSVPKKTFQDKSLEEWTGILMRERSADALAQAMEAVQILADTPDEKATAAHLFLRASRQLGGESSGMEGRPPSVLPNKLFMYALEIHFPILYSNAPESGLIAIANELEKGTVQSKLACLSLLKPFKGHDRDNKPKMLFSEMSQKSESRRFLLKLDELVKVWISANESYPYVRNNTRDTAIRFRIAVGKALERDLKLDPQIMDWARLMLQQAKAYLTNKFPSTIDDFSAAMTYRLLEGTDLDLSSLVVGLLHSLNELAISELESIVADLCQRNPVECALACEAYLKRGAGLFTNDSRGKLVLENLGKHHPRPMDAILTMLGKNSPVEENLPTYKQLLVRVVLETNLISDPEADSKLAFAAFAFANFEVPTEDATKVMTVFLARLRDYEPKSIGLPYTLNATWPSLEARSYKEESRMNFWTIDRLRFHVLDCIRRSPSGGIPAIAEELRAGNDKIASYCYMALLPAIVKLTVDEKRVFAVQNDVDKTLLGYLQTDSGRTAMVDLGTACDIAIQRMLPTPVPQHVEDFDIRFQVLILHRLLISRFLNQDTKDNETISKALRHIVASGLVMRFITIAEAIAELEGYVGFSHDRLLRLAKAHGGDEINAPKFVDRIFESSPTELRSFFLNHLETIAAGKNRDDISDNFHRLAYASQPADRKSVWHSIVRKLLADPEGRERTLVAVKEIIKVANQDENKERANRIAASLQSCLPPRGSEMQ